MVVNGLSQSAQTKIDQLGISFSSQLLPSTVLSDKLHTGDPTPQGRSLLLPIVNQESNTKNPSDATYFSSSWVQIDLESQTKEILFTLFPRLDTFHQPQVRWPMERLGGNISSSIIYRLLANSNNMIYALGSSDTGLVMSMFPQNISFIPPYVESPAISDIITIHAPGVGLDCALENTRTRMIADRGAVYLTCFPSEKNGVGMSSYKVYKFSEGKFQQLSDIPLEIISTDINPNPPFLIPIPAEDSNPATWAMVSLGNGESKFYNLNGLTANVPHQPMIFKTNQPYTFDPFTRPESGQNGTEEPLITKTTIGILVGAAGFGLLMAMFGMLVYRSHQRNERQRELEGAVHREVYGDDASDSLPCYTPHAAANEHGGFFGGIFYSLGRSITRPPSYKTTLSILLSRSDTRATMCHSTTEEEAAENSMHETEMPADQTTVQVSDSELEPSSEPTPESTAEVAVESALEVSTEAASEVARESAPEVASESASESAPEPAPSTYHIIEFSIESPILDEANNTKNAFQLYTFNRKTLKHINPLATLALISETHLGAAPHLKIIGGASSNKAQWSCLSLDCDAKGHSLDLSTNTTVQTDINNIKPFSIDFGAEFSDMFMK
ncbi:hypothetical protein FBU30_004478 [Linnemannia zychae]|nr:hypothetical protein FBU30_004478 [Linnemannia zychae]